MSVCFRWGLESPGTGGSFFGGTASPADNVRENVPLLKKT